MSRSQAKTVLLSLIAGYMIASILSGTGFNHIFSHFNANTHRGTSRVVSGWRNAKPDRRAVLASKNEVLERDALKDEMMWAGHMVEQEIMRGKYQRSDVEAIKADFEYYRMVHAMGRDLRPT